MDAGYFAGETIAFSSAENWKENTAYHEELLSYKIAAEAWVRAGRPLSAIEQADSLSASAMVPDARRFDYIQLAVWACLACLGVQRLVAYLTRSKAAEVQQVWIARRATRGVILFLLLLVHGALAVAFSWPLPVEWIPTWLSSHVVDTTQMKVVGTILLAAAVGVFLLARQGRFRVARNAMPMALLLLTVGTTLSQGRLIFFVLAAAIVALLCLRIHRGERFAIESSRKHPPPAAATV